MRIVVLVNSLDSGGAEKSGVKFFRAISSEGFETFLCTVTNTLDFYPLHPNEIRFNLDDNLHFKRINTPIKIGINFLRNMYARLVQLYRLRKLVLETGADAVVAFSALMSVMAFLALLGCKVTIIGSERIHPDSKVWSHGKIVDKLRPLIYRRGVHLSVQSSGVRDWCRKNWGIDGQVTPNQLDFAVSSKSLSIRNGYVLSMGRDHPQKGTDNLLHAWLQVEKFDDRTLLLVGAADTSRLESQIEILGLRNVKAATRTNQVSNVFSQASIFVSASLFEGFPNVVLEAMAHGIPVVSTKSCDVIEEFAAKGGCIAVDTNSPELLALAIREVLENEELYSRLALTGLEIAKQYEWENVRKTWFELLQNASKTKHRVGFRQRAEA